MLEISVSFSGHLLADNWFAREEKGFILAGALGKTTVARLLARKHRTINNNFWINANYTLAQ